MNKTTIKGLGITVSLLLANNIVEAKKSQPNIVFILVDDLGYADVGFNGSKYFETPKMDALAAQSLVFENSYMYPTSSPSRAALFTGKQSFRTGVYTVPVLEEGTAQENIFSRWTVGLEHQFHAQLMAKVGYQSIHVGKYHVVGPYPEKELALPYLFDEKLSQPDPADFSWLSIHKSKEIMKYYPEGRGFMKNVGGTYRGDPAMEIGGLKSKTGGYFAPFSNPYIEPKPTDEWLTDRLTDEVLQFMDENKKGPFFVNFNLYAVHNPIRGRSQEQVDYFMKKEGDPILGQGVGPKKKTMAEYATMIKSVDDNVQRIVDFLDKNGLRENTIIILSSDNGYNGGISANNKMRAAKGSIYEGGIRVPTLINWPGNVTARRTQTPISCFDYFATFIDLAGVKNYKDDMDGNSLTSIFKSDKKKFDKRPLFWQLNSQYKHGTCSAIRKNNFKLIQFLADGKLELYDLQNDPLETTNLADKLPKQTEKLVEELEQWRKKNQVPFPPNAKIKKN